MGSEDPGRALLSRTRAAVYALFAAFGLVIGTWAVHLPSLKQATGISTSLLGTVVLILGVGAMVGMRLSAPLIDRFGSQRIAVLGCCLMSVAIPVPFVATSFAEAAVAALLLGVATGTADVAMNAAAVVVERCYDRPIMASFHGVFSVGTVVGSLVSAGGFALETGVLPIIVGVAVGCLLIVAIAAPVLLRRRDADAAHPGAQAAGDAPDATGRRPRRVYVLAMLSFLLFLVEGSAMDWSSLHAQQHLGSSSTWGSMAFGSFVGAMTFGRFTVDRLAGRIGPVAVFRWGSILAAAGLTAVVLSPVLPLTLVAWVVTGLGLAGGMPQVFTAAGNVGSSSGRSLALVVGVGYAAILGGPAVLGWVAERLTLNDALVIPLCAVLLCSFLAKAVQPQRA